MRGPVSLGLHSGQGSIIRRVAEDTELSQTYKRGVVLKHRMPMRFLQWYSFALDPGAIAVWVSVLDGLVCEARLPNICKWCHLRASVSNGGHWPYLSNALEPERQESEHWHVTASNKLPEPRTLPISIQLICSVATIHENELCYTNSAG